MPWQASSRSFEDAVVSEVTLAPHFGDRQMKNYKRQMPLHYVKPEAGESRPIFSYLLLANAPVDGRFLIQLVNLKDEDQPHALKNRLITMVTDDPQEAFVGAVAQINSHHDGLKPLYDLAAIDKDRSEKTTE